MFLVTAVDYICVQAKAIAARWMACQSPRSCKVFRYGEWATPAGRSH